MGYLFRDLFHILVTLLLLVQMILYPMFSYASPLRVDVSVSTRPTVTFTGSGRPVVNIVAPSAAGTSHNRFRDYNVGVDGVILNNGVSDSGSFRDGVIGRNPHFVGSPARVILNEVTGISSSRLSGETEVVGSSASVIVANPHGVVCDGCSFQNTPRVTLTTGVADSSKGDVTLDISRGKVLVEGAGLRQGGIDRVDLVGRRVVIDGAVQLGLDAELNIIAGTNSYDYASGNVTVKDGKIPVRGAIDASVLGAMEAGRITVMSTTQGAGVRLDGNMASTLGSLTIDVAGNIGMGVDRDAGVAYAPQSVTSKNNLVIRTDGELNKNSNSYSYRNTRIEAVSVKNTGRVDADNDLSVTVFGNYENSGKLDAARDMALDFRGRAHNSGIVDAGRDLVVHTGGDLINDDVKITAGDTIRLDGTGNVVNRDTDMYAVGGIVIDVPNLQHRGVSYLGSDGTVTIMADHAIENLDHDSVIQAGGALSLIAGGLIDNRFGQILGGSDILLRAPSIINQNGLIAATGESGDIIIDASHVFDNRNGILRGINTISINAELLDNSEGRITAGGGLFATLGGLQNTDGVMLADGRVVVNATGLLSNAYGTIASLSSDVALEAQDIDTSYGAVIGTTGLSLQTFPGGILTATGAYLQTDGTLSLTSGGDLSLAQSNLLAGVLVLSAADDLYAPYSILAGTDAVTLDAGGLLTLAGDGATGLVVSNGDIIVNAGSMGSRGAALQAGMNLTVDVAGDMHGENTVFAAQDVRVSAGGLLENAGASFLSDTSLLLESVGDMNIDFSRLLANDNITVNAGGALSANDIRSGFVVDADGNITVVSELLVMSGASIQAARAAVMGNLDVSLAALSGDMVSSDGILFSNTGIVVDSAGATDIGGTSVTAPDQLSIHAGGDVVVSDAALVSNADITIDSGGTFINTGANGYVLTGGETTQVVIDAASFNSTGGAILANNGITLTSDGDMLLGSVLHSNTDLFLTTQSGDIINQGGEVTVIGSLLVSTGGNVYNSGTMIVQEGFDLSIGGVFDNSVGTVSTVDDVNITANSILNNGGNIISGGLVLLQATNGISNNGGNIFATTTLMANSGSGTLDNTGGVLESLGNMTLTAGSDIYNTGGTIVTNGTLQINVASGSIDNIQDGMLQSAGDLSITAGHIRNGDSGTHGQILSGGDIDINILNDETSPNNFGNGSGGYVGAAGSIYVTSAGRLGNTGGSYVAGQDIVINTHNMVLNGGGGLMQAGNDLSITTMAGGVDNYGGTLYAGNDLTINATSQDFLLIADWHGLHNQPVSALENSNGGSITSGGAMTLNVRDLHNEGGEIISNGNLNINVSNNENQVPWSTNNNGGLIHSNGDLTLNTTGELYSVGGEISAVGRVDLYATEAIDNSAGGIIRGGGAVDIRNYAGNLSNYNGGLIESTASIDIDLGEHVPNPDYAVWQQQTAAYDACVADPICIPGAVPGGAPVQFIRGDVLNGGGVITAPAVSIIARAVLNDPIFGQGAGGTTLTTNQLLQLLDPGSADGTVDSANTREFDTVTLQQSGDQSVNAPAMAEVADYIHSLPGAGQLTDDQIAYLMANYGYLARQVLDTGAQLQLYGGSGIGNLAGVLSGFSSSSFAAGGVSPGTVSDPQALADALAAQTLLEQAIAFFINENQQTELAAGDKASLVVPLRGLSQLAPASGNVVKIDSNMLAFLTPGNLQGGQIIANDLIITADEGIYNIGGTITANNLGILSAKRITNAKAVLADGSLSGGDITGANLVLNASETLTNIGGKIKAEGLLAINAGSLTNEALTDATGNILAKGRLRGNDIQLTLQEQLTTNSGSVIRADNNLIVSATQGITNNAGAILKSGGDMQLTTEGAFLNLGDITIGGQGLIAAGSFENALATKTITKTTSSEDNQPLFRRGRGVFNPAPTIETTTHEIIESMGTITAGNGLSILSDTTVTNTGTLDAGEGTLHIEGTIIRNKPVLGTTTTTKTEADPNKRNTWAYLMGDATKTTSSSSQKLFGGGNMRGKNITLIASDKIINRGNITAEDNVILQAKNIVNKATVLAQLTRGNSGFSKKSADMMYREITKNQALNRADTLLKDAIYSGGELSYSIVPDNGVISGKNTIIAAEDIVLNNGRMLADNNLTIMGSDIINMPLMSDYFGNNYRQAGIVHTETGTMLGRNVTAIADSSITNAGGVIAGTDNVNLLAGVTVNEQGNLSLSGEKGQVTLSSIVRTWTNSSYRRPFEFVGGEVMSGGDVLIAAGDSIDMIGTDIGAVGDITMAAGNNLTAAAAAGKFVAKKTRSMFSASYHEKVIQRAAGITSTEGNIALSTNIGDITLAGAQLNARALSAAPGAGQINIHAGRDAILDAVVTEEIHKRTKTGVTGIVVAAIVIAVSCVYAACQGAQLLGPMGLTTTGVAVAGGVAAGSIAGQGTLASHTDTDWNDHNVTLTSLSARDINLTAGQDISGEGALFFAENNILTNAARNNRLDSEKVTKYIKEQGWTLSGSAGAFGASTDHVNALTDGGLGALKDSVIAGNPLLGSIDNLKNVDGGLGLLNVANVGLQGVRVLGAQGNMLGAAGFGEGAGVNVSVRLGVQNSETQWTESYLSQLTAGGNIQMGAGEKMQLIGGTQASAGVDITLHGGSGVEIVANEDWMRSKSSGVGVTLGYGSGGYRVGADGNRFDANGETYTNAMLEAGGGIAITSGGNIDIIGANIHGKDVVIDGVGDVNIASVQNIYTSDNEGFSVGASKSGAYSAGVSQGSADRLFTDDQTTVVGSESVVVRSEDNTNIGGAVVANIGADGIDQGNLLIDTSTLTFNDLIDNDDSEQTSVGVSYGGKNGHNVEGQPTGGGIFQNTGSVDYANQDIDGVTRATVGNGMIAIRDPENQEQDVSSLNRDITKSQEITGNEGSTASVTLPITTPEKVKAGLNEIKTAGKTIGRHIDIAQTTQALKKAYGEEAAIEGKIMLERWAVGDAHALDGCIGGGSAWNFLVSEAYANPAVMLGTAGCSMILAVAVVTAVNSGNQHLIPDNIRNDATFLEQMDLTLNEDGTIISKDLDMGSVAGITGDTSFSCRFMGRCELKLPSDEGFQAHPNEGTIYSTPVYDDYGNVLVTTPANITNDDEGFSILPDWMKVVGNVYTYKPAPRDLEAFPDAVRVRPKTSVQGGGGLRKRWKDSDGNIYEWDSQHGAVEAYNSKGKHIGEFDAKTGQQLKPSNPTRKVEP